jgi:hypothetical protein
MLDSRRPALDAWSSHEFKRFNSAAGPARRSQFMSQLDPTAATLGAVRRGVVRPRASGLALPPPDPYSPVPMWYQIFCAVRANVETGTLGCGAALPTGAQLTRELGVTRKTVDRALRELADAGWIYRHSRTSFKVPYGAGLRSTA